MRHAILIIIIVMIGFNGRNTHHAAGFTLIELLVVIAIIGLLAAVVLAAIGPARAKSRDARRAADIRAVQTALELYANDHSGQYPSTGALNTVYMDPGCKTATAPDLITSDWVPGLVSGGYMRQLPQDPLPTSAADGYNGGGACYMYSSDGTYFILSAWSTIEGTVTGGGLYSLAGYREPSWNVQNAAYMCNYQGGPLPPGSYFAKYYAHSYTVTNLTCP